MPIVLVVDEEPMLLAMIETALRIEGVETWTAPDAEHALAALQDRGSIDLLITEVQLPGMDGAALAAQLVARDPALPVLFLSADLRVMPLGGSPQFAFLAKPFPLADLVGRVRTLLRMAVVPVAH